MITHLQPIKKIDATSKHKLRDHFDHLAHERVRYRDRNHYYYDELIKSLRFLIQPDKKILEVGCADGYVLEHLNPSSGTGIDISENMIEIAKNRHGQSNNNRLNFVTADIENVTFTETFDYILMSDVLGSLLDIQQALENLRSACNDETRIIIHYHSILWEPLFKVLERLRLKMPQPEHNWLSFQDINHFLTLSDFELVNYERRMLAPKYIPLVSWLLNRYASPLPLVNALCMTNLFVIRKKQRGSRTNHSATILIPCRNEKGNIRQAIDRIPNFASAQQIIFVDGHSTDGTREEIEQVIAENPEKDMEVWTQPGRGKGDAVRYGFAKAHNDILMILDADLTVPPEDLPKFYDAIASGKGEFINGTRLVYAMERDAMRYLNIMGNKFFSVALSWLLNQSLKDTLCGTKVLLRTDYERIAAGRHYFGDFDPFGDFDLIFGAAKLNLKIVEVPIRYRDRTYGSTNISRFYHGWLLLKMTLFALRKLKLA